MLESILNSSSSFHEQLYFIQYEREANIQFFKTCNFHKMRIASLQIVALSLLCISSFLSKVNIMLIKLIEGFSENYTGNTRYTRY